jgi:hypothetical protein
MIGGKRLRSGAAAWVSAVRSQGESRCSLSARSSFRGEASVEGVCASICDRRFRKRQRRCRWSLSTRLASRYEAVATARETIEITNDRCIRMSIAGHPRPVPTAQEGSGRGRSAWVPRGARSKRKPMKLSSPGATRTCDPRIRNPNSRFPWLSATSTNERKTARYEAFSWGWSSTVSTESERVVGQGVASGAAESAAPELVQPVDAERVAVVAA